jgi:tRNA (adenine57-N1/adenine58-N1)-methyltransferase
VKERLVIRRAKKVEYEPGRWKTLYPYKEYTVPIQSFDADSFRLTEDQVRRTGTYTVEGQTIHVLPLNNADVFRDLQRGPQSINPKDVGYILQKTAVGKKDAVLEAGTGTGETTARIALNVRRVDTYERDPRSLSVARENLSALNVSNVSLHDADVSKAASKPDGAYALTLLDLPSPEKYVSLASRVTELNGWVCFYCPQISQVKDIKNSVPNTLLHDETLRVLGEHWRVDPPVLRPQTAGPIHTAFLSFYRKVKE